MTGCLELESPAKINLFLKVTGRRPDGYHDLVSLMGCISLQDRIVLQPGVAAIKVTCSFPGVPEDSRNLAAQAAELFYVRYPSRERVAIEIEKQIPVGAGLGGGSSNAAAVLSGLNAHYGQPFSANQLIRMGASIGADVPFFLFGRPALATGIGDRLTAYEGLNRSKVVVIYPGFSIQTASVYKKLNLGLTKCENHLKCFFLKQDRFLPAQHLCNDLETVVIPRYPEIAAAKKKLLENGATGALMSGSGSSVFGMFADSQTAHLAGKALASYYGGAVFVADLLV
ncbi:MAG: 4-(cytidine 5'-diphospho)-2-C-methyl-D-erythritol kinase [Desulfobacterales bacterium]|nr:4-(cytidine 5'-diphospho)-2-C-methyl-D-erythritol kinase [Desulfobacterales bacterium]